MKYKTQILLICFLCTSLLGCYESSIRFWNGGSHISKKENKAYDECMDKLAVSLPRPKTESSGSKEMQEWQVNVYGPKLTECMKRKGF
ncbi:hypothetical protein [Snodgrassella alvi]|uniref:hypothetical protein n=1 Tax=Snodgrassella alvi TaxID=1196083 RepID=UPI00117ADBB4|nr:hypothetical protein [Snodgrassella alvi]